MGPHTSRALVLLLTSLLWVPGLAQSQAPPPDPALLPGYWFQIIAVPTAGGQIGRSIVTGFNSNRPPQLTVALDFVDDGLRQPGLIVTPGGTIEAVHCNAETRWTVIQGINQQKDTAGWCYQEDGHVQAFFRGSSGDVTLIPIPGAVHSEATDVNNHKQVVGWFRGEDINARGFVWNARTRQLTTFDAPFPTLGGPFTIPLVINNHQIVGGLYGIDSEDTHGFLYDVRRRTWETIEPPQADISLVTGLNDTGTALVFADTFHEGGRAFTYSTQTKTFTPLPWALPFPSQGNWQSINNAGQLLGEQFLDVVPDDPDAPGGSFRLGVLATPLPPGVVGGTPRVGRSVAQSQMAALNSDEAGPARTRPALVLAGCPGDGQARPGKLAMSWIGCDR